MLTFDGNGSLNKYEVTGNYSATATTGILENYHPEDTSHLTVQAANIATYSSSIDFTITTSINYVLTITESNSQGGSSGSNNNLSLFLDTNGNGKFDITDQPIASSISVVANQGITEEGTLPASTSPYGIVFSGVASTFVNNGPDNAMFTSSSDFDSTFTVLPEMSSFSSAVIFLAAMGTFSRNHRTNRKLSR
jgi:hypothetical protein